MEIPQELKDRFDKLEKKEQAIKAKLKSTLEYKRRKLDKDVKRHTKGNRVIKFREIDRIGRHYGFYTEGTQFREDTTPRKDA